MTEIFDILHGCCTLQKWKLKAIKKVLRESPPTAMHVVADGSKKANIRSKTMLLTLDPLVFLSRLLLTRLLTLHISGIAVQQVVCNKRRRER